MREKTVLLVEDDPAHEALFRRAVEESGVGCVLDVAHDGVEAIEYLFASGENGARDSSNVPDLILLDLRMPRMDGLQVLQVLRRVRGDSRAPHVPVVVITSSEHDQDITEAYRLGAQSYLCKPCDYGQFAQTVRETLQYWLDLNRSAPRPQPRRFGVTPTLVQVGR